jgi:polyphenol oxidase
MKKEASHTGRSQFPFRRSRREFLRGAGVLAAGLAASDQFDPRALGAWVDEPACALPTPPAGTEPQAPAYSFPPAAPQRVRRSLAEVVADQASLNELVKAYGALKALQSTPDDPVNWCNQANIHYNHCSLGPGAYYLQIHFGWLFLPWHRGYLYFYETILGYLVGNPSFALPYWDWTSTPVVPDVFFDPNSPLYDETRAISQGQSIEDDPEVFRYTQASYIKYLENLPHYSPPRSNPLAPSFGGPPDDTEANSRFQGRLEAGPHDSVHTWVGGDMGSFDTAARDLLFFGHHANVDRLWWLWQQGHGHTNPTSQTWSNQWFNFWNPQQGQPPTGVSQSIIVADTVNPQAVNVIYQPPPQAVAAAAAQPRARREDVFVPEGTPITIPLASKQRARIASESADASAAGELHLEGVEIPQQRGIRLRIFINKPDADASTPITDSHYVGTIFLVPMRAQSPPGANQHGMAHVHNYSLVIPNSALALTREAGDSKVTIVPVRRAERSTGAQIKLKSAALIRPQ